MKKNINWKVLILCLLIPQAIGGLSGWLTQSGMKQFDDLQKPLLTPPKLVFPIAWVLLFLLMGLASYYIYSSYHDKRRMALVIYGTQLVVNFLWSIFFFNMQWHLFSFWWIILLIVLVVSMTVQFFRCQKVAGYLVLPYLLWLIFAAYLNYGIYVLNG